MRKYPDLAALLVTNCDEITTSWAKAVMRLPESHFQHITFAEAKAWAEEALRQIVMLLESGSTRELDLYLYRIAQVSHKSGFSLSDLNQAMLLAKDSIAPVTSRCIVKDSVKEQAWIAHLNSCLRHMIGQLSDLSVAMIEENFSREVHKHLIESESLQRTTTALLEPLTLDEVLEIVCTEACRLTGATGSAVLLLEEAGWLQIPISSGYPKPVLERLSVADSVAGMVLRRGKPWKANDVRNQVQAYHRNSDLQTLLVIPMLGKGGAIGALDVVNKPGGFSEEDVQLMSLFANQAAIAIENARLRRQAEQLAVIEERQRIARDLHDSLAQALYTVSLYTDAARLALASGKREVVGQHLKDLRNMVREAMLDMRLLVFELHPPSLEEEGLVTALRTRLEAVEARSSVKADFHVSGERRLPIELEVEIYRIAQEVLTNVVKHAKAQDVTVHLNFSDESFSLEIRDNGVGFDPHKEDSRGGMGLRGIRERVKQLGGTLAIDSVFGRGTAVRVDLELWKGR